MTVKGCCLHSNSAKFFALLKNIVFRRIMGTPAGVEHLPCTFSNFNKKYFMRYSKLLCSLLMIGFTGICAAQKTVVAPVQKINTLKIEFNKQETEYAEVQNDLKQLEQLRSQLLEMMRKFNEQQKMVMGKVEKLERSYNNINATASGQTQSQLLDATKQMQETQMSFNLQYLQLQSQMQNENRSYTAVSNIMKTKHDTVKNSISNIR
jgi:septal ring factor EnvC (AmiA/AmiB activator)